MPPHLIDGIAGYSQEELDELLRHYPARTANRAAKALQMRLEHEAAVKEAR